MRGSGWMGALAGAVWMLSGGCGGDDGPGPGMPDAGGAADAEVRDTGSDGVCASDPDCDDGVFCNGAERCDATGACHPGAPPDCDDAIACTTDRCDEDTRACRHPPLDADGDGHAAASCLDDAGAPLGDDCDDDDARRYPGRPEACDTAGLDEDCDPATLGADGDGDGYVLIACCNEQPDGSTVCGEDCDDLRMEVNPEATEACNRIDDDCDGTADEMVQMAFYRDLDGDGFGLDAMTVMDCAAPFGYAVTGGDCDDTTATAHPGAFERCDGTIDHDCNGMVDDGCDCRDGAVRDCGPSDGMGGINETGECARGLQQCIGGIWTASCAGAVSPRGEVCNGLDEDCDTRIDEMASDAVDWYRDVDGDGYGARATTMRRCTRPAGYVGDSTDCDDTRAVSHPGGVEVCDRRDNDCSSGGGVETAEDVDGDGEAPAAATCLYAGPGTLPKTDCRDDIATVNTAHAPFETVPACVTGRTPCSATHVRPPASSSTVWVCLPPGMACMAGLTYIGTVTDPLAHWDWNCSGSFERPNAGGPTHCSQSSSSCIPCYAGDSYMYDPITPPACGAPTTFERCGGGCTCGVVVATEMRPMACR